MNKPARSEVWFANLSPTQGREQHGDRPVLILSVDKFNDGPSGLVITVPISRTDRNIPSHVRLDGGHGGLKQAGFIMCEQLRCISKARLRRLCGTVDSKVMAEVAYRVNALMGL